MIWQSWSPQAEIKAALADLDNTLIAWNKPWWDAIEMKQWLHTCYILYLRIIVVSTQKRVQCSWEIWDWLRLLGSEAFTFGIDRAKEFHYEKSEVVMVGDQLMTDIRAAHRAGTASTRSSPWVQHDLQNADNRAVSAACENHYTTDYIKANSNYGRNSLYWLWATIQTTDKAVLDYPQSALEKRLETGEAPPTLFPFLTTMKITDVQRTQWPIYFWASCTRWRQWCPAHISLTLMDLSSQACHVLSQWCPLGGNKKDILPAC